MPTNRFSQYLVISSLAAICTSYNLDGNSPTPICSSTQTSPIDGYAYVQVTDGNILSSNTIYFAITCED